MFVLLRKHSITKKGTSMRVRTAVLSVVTLVLAILAATSTVNAQKQAGLPKPPNRFEYVNLGSFSIAFPKGAWKFIPLQGVDSYVGAFLVGKKDTLRLEFDLGFYSSKPDTNPGYTVIHEVVNGKNALISFPTNGAPGLTGISIDFGKSHTSDNRISLFLYGEDLNAREQKLALAIFRTIYVSYKE